MCYLKEKSAYLLFIFLISAIFIARPQFVYSDIEFDTEPPSVVHTSPADGDTGVPVNSLIEVLFSEFLDTSFSNLFSIDPDIGGQLTWGQYDPTLIFTPDMLLYNTTYEVTIGTEATDLSGNSLEDPYEWSFITESLPWLHFQNIQGLSLDQNHPVKLILGDINGDIWAVVSSSEASDDLFVFNGFDQSDFDKIDESFGKINAIEQDSGGYIWIASESDDPGEGGVHVFDGTDWTHYNSNTEPVFSDNSILCLTVDSADNIWVGSKYSGIYWFDGTSWTNYTTTTPNSYLTNDWIAAIEADENDNIWFATTSGGIEVFDQQTDTWTSYKSDIVDESGINLFISEIVSGSGSIWAATDLGLLKYDYNEWDFFTQIDGTYTLLNSITFDPANDILWVGTDTGLVRFDDPNGESIIMDNVGPAVLETSMDVYGNLWIGTSNSLSRYDITTPVLLSVSPSNNKTNVSTSTKIILVFSEPMNKDAVTSALSFSPTVSFTSSMDASSTKLTITPKAKLKSGKTYTITVGKNAADKQGRRLNKSTSSSFKTKKSTTAGGTYPSTSYGLPATTPYAFPYTTAFRLPATTPFTFPGISTFRFPSTSFTFPGTSTYRFPSTSWTSSPFRPIGSLVYPRF